MTFSPVLWLATSHRIAHMTSNLILKKVARYHEDLYILCWKLNLPCCVNSLMNSSPRGSFDPPPLWQVCPSYSQRRKMAVFACVSTITHLIELQKRAAILSPSSTSSSTAFVTPQFTLKMTFTTATTTFKLLRVTNGLQPFTCSTAPMSGSSCQWVQLTPPCNSNTS
jgi:hypothetical protein